MIELNFCPDDYHLVMLFSDPFLPYYADDYLVWRDGHIGLLVLIDPEAGDTPPPDDNYSDYVGTLGELRAWCKERDYNFEDDNNDPDPA